MLEKADGKSYAQACYLPTQADRYVMAFRNWISEFQADPFPGRSLPAEISKPALLDRYSSHTQHCGSCRPALKNIQKLRRGVLILSAVVWSGVPLGISVLGTPTVSAGVVLTGIPLAAGALWLWLGNLERKFYQGSDVPPRNLPGK